MSSDETQKRPTAPTREDRVATALRENLRKRKQQAQARADQTDTSKG